MKNIIAISGSIRKHSYNTALVSYVCENYAQANIQRFDIAQLPFFSEDYEPKQIPTEVANFRSKLLNADGVLISTPEYNSFFSGVLKNSLEWASRNYQGVLPLADKPVAVMGVTPGGFGTVRAQLNLIGLLNVLQANVYNNSRINISGAKELFSSEGKILDAGLKDNITKFITSFINSI